MMGFQIVVLWSDVLVWLLVAAGVGVGVLIAKNPPLLAAWRRVGANRVGMAAATLLLAFIAVGLLDSMHYRLALESKPGQPKQYAIEVLSVLDALAAPLRTKNEKTYSAPLADTLHSKETVDLPDGQQARVFPRLKFAATQLGDPATELEPDVLRRAGGHPGHIFNLGHGVMPESDPDVLKRVVDTVHAEGTVR